MEIVKDPATWLGMFDEFIMCFFYFVVVDQRRDNGSVNWFEESLILTAFLLMNSRVHISSIIALWRYLSSQTDGLSFTGALIGQLLAAFLSLIFRNSDGAAAVVLSWNEMISLAIISLGFYYLASALRNNDNQTPNTLEVMHHFNLRSDQPFF